MNCGQGVTVVGVLIEMGSEKSWLMVEHEGRDLDDMKEPWRGSVKALRQERAWCFPEPQEEPGEAGTRRGRGEVVRQGWQEGALTQATRGLGNCVTALPGGQQLHRGVGAECIPHIQCFI